jgi:hypothetical protein
MTSIGGADEKMPIIASSSNVRIEQAMTVSPRYGFADGVHELQSGGDVLSFILGGTLDSPEDERSTICRLLISGIWLDSPPATKHDLVSGKYATLVCPS